ncbi:hypothetical protein Pmani_026840 [Petrolisthes manimaculis]|uniref:Chitin-binding type-2 domain-containing protein n=1 Tax=Petrolisthes manimaculis TaxID=1843537 RepID=A0AAE1TXF6_9EUCA|nr:hypothetical protein Pmani_026840 [Petrolisthes manimaculis]
MVGARCVTGYTTAGSCVPECMGIADGMNVVDPKNCYRYYTCQNEIANAVPHQCSVLQYFDATTKQCVTGQCPRANCVPACKFESVGPSQLAHRTDCNKYYLYDGIGQPKELFCPTNSYFNGDTCTSDPNECCAPCLVYCESKDIYVSDPLDCNRFYYCQEDAYFPEELDLFACPVGEFYSTFSRQCTTEDSSCTQVCVDE